MLLRLAYLGVTNMVALLRLLPRSDHDKDTEILVLSHQLAMLQRQLGGQRVRFMPTDRALLAALLQSSATPGRTIGAACGQVTSVGAVRPDRNDRGSDSRTAYVTTHLFSVSPLV